MSDDEPSEIEIDDGAEPERPEPDNAADPKQAERKSKRLARQRREGAAFWRSVFASEVGRREMWGVLSAGHILEDRFACGPNGFPQIEATWFAAGEKALAQRLLDSWDIIDHEGVYLMKCEHDHRYADAQPPQRKVNL